MLNEGQMRAVDTIEGPVMVVAGPGTGKTEVVALRVANILRKTHARPGNILCLTFSVSGATAMRERLRLLIGPDAYGVSVRNFHGFCSDLISENPLVFDAWSALEPISDVERYRQVNKIIDQLLPQLSLVNLKNPYLKTKEIIGRISTLKREGVTDREHLLQIASEYEQDLASRSKEGTKAHEKNLLTAKKFSEFLEIFFRYQAMLRETQRYDYEDMILFVLEALKEEDWLLAGLQERYQYILVDEFQDTNGAQAGLIDILTRPPSPEDKPNLFVVGDDDQAIYRFQGANLGNILQFRLRFPDAPVIPLTVSYRCTQPILDAAESLISRNTERLVGRIDGLDKHLISGAKENDGVSPQLLFSQSDSTEPWMIADLVEERVKAGIPPHEIAVLCQTNAEVLGLADVFAARGIPADVVGKNDLLGHPLVAQAIAILQAIESPENNSALAGALGCACFGVHPATLARMFQDHRDQKKSLLAVLLDVETSAESREDSHSDVPIGISEQLPICHSEPQPVLSQPKHRTATNRGMSWFDAAHHDIPTSDLGISKINYARDVLLDLHQKLPSRTVVDTLEHLLKETGLLALARGDEQGGKKFDPVSFAALQEFFDRLKNRAYEQPHFSFSSFLSDLEYFLNPEYSDLRMGFDLPHLTEDGVRVQTAHQSKGLEFTVVILMNFREGHWDKRRNPSSLSIPEDRLFGWVKDQKDFEKNQDERRVTYVAMTRAKKELIFTCPKELTSGDKTRSVSPSGFFAEAGKLPEELRSLLNPTHSSLLLYEPVLDFDAEMKAFLLSKLENYALSVTALNHFLEDPKLFLELDLLGTPQAKQPSLIYGNAVHDALRRWGLSVMEGKPLDQAGFLSAFRRYLEEREILTNAERARLVHLGEQSLPRYFEARLSGSLPFVHKVEYAVTTRFDDPSTPLRTSVPIKGKIDRIDLLQPESSDAIIVDYKTGRPKSEAEIRTDGDYFRQLVFYALLLEEKGALLSPKEFVLDFIGEGSEHPVQRAFTISAADIEELKKVVKQVWGKIVALDFSPL